MNASDLRYGTVSQIDARLGRVKVKFHHDGIESWWLQVPQCCAGGARSYSMPRKGNTVGVLLDESAENGIVVGTFYNKKEKAPVMDPLIFHVDFEDKTVIEYDPLLGVLTVDMPRPGGRIKMDASIIKINCSREAW